MRLVWAHPQPKTRRSCLRRMWLFETTLQRKGRNAVQQFIGKHQDQIAGVLSGFDRLVLRGTLRSIAYGQGMSQYLWASQVLLKNFGAHVEQVSERLKAGSLAEVVAAGRPVRYLASSTVSTEKIARRIAAEDGITSWSGVRADLRRAVPQLPDLPQPRH